MRMRSDSSVPAAGALVMGVVLALTTAGLATPLNLERAARLREVREAVISPSGDADEGAGPRSSRESALPR